jgi:eukaryotic-like serine/threonine-protein kinase
VAPTEGPGSSATITDTDAPPQAELVIGQLFGDYEVLGEHARGGAGRILRARDRRLDRIVALKVPLARDPIAIARFTREARLTARLQHPAIVQVYDEGALPNGEPFYAMRLVEGRSLRDAIIAAPDLEARLALLPYLIATTQAIAYAHDRGVIHRDLKPSNVILGSLGEVVVVDWGLARTLRDGDDEVTTRAAAGDAELTVAGAVIGTPAYMPPEQALGERVDEHADVYALGAMGYHIVSARPPFEGDGDTALRELRVGPPRELARLEPGIPVDLAAVLAKAMARAPEDRYPNAAALARDLEHFRSGRLVAARDYPVHVRFVRWVQRHRTTVAIAGLLGTAIVAIVVIAAASMFAERAAARARVDDLVLEEADGALERDPTETLAWLAHYPPDAPSWQRASVLAVDASSRGVARHVLHVDNPTALAFVSNTLVAQTRDGAVSAWDAPTGSPAPVPKITLLPARIARRGAWSVEGDSAGVVRVTNHADGVTRTYRGHTDAIAAVAIGDTHFASASRDGGVRIWDLASDAGRSFGGHSGVVEHVRVDPRGGRIVSIARDRAVRTIDLASGESRELARLDADPVGLAIATDGTIVVAQASSLRVWRPDGSTAEIVLPEELVAISLAGPHRVVALGDDAYFVDLATGTVEPLPIDARKRGGFNWDVRAASDARWLVTNGWSRAPEILEPATRRTYKLDGHRGDDVIAIELTQDEHIVTAGVDGTVRVWDPTGHQVARHEVGREPMIVAGARDANQIAAGADDRLWLAGRAGLRLSAAITHAVFGPDGTVLAASLADGTVWLVEPESGRMRVFHCAAPAGGIAFTVDGRSIVAGDAAGTVWVLPAKLETSAQPTALAAWIAGATTARIEPGQALGSR